MDKTRYFTRADSKQVVENKISGSFTHATDSRSRVSNSDSGSSSTRNQLKPEMIKKMQRAKACFINTDKNECGTSLQRSSTRRASKQTHERKTNVFEGDTVNNNNVRRKMILEKSELEVHRLHRL
jgi:hypothetical protein